METRRLKNTRSRCDACDGSGTRAPASPSCTIAAPGPLWIAVERCDACEKYPDDLAAALAEYRVAGWFFCASCALHAFADARTLRRRVSVGASRRDLRPRASS